MYIINPNSASKEISNTYPTSSSTGSSTAASSQEIISQILTKCATTMSDEVAATSGIATTATVNGTATLLLSPSHHHHHHHHNPQQQQQQQQTLPVVGVSPQSSPASSSSNASSPIADGPQSLHNSFGTGREKLAGASKNACSSGGTNGTSGAIAGAGGGRPGSAGTGGGGNKANSNGALPAPISASTNSAGGRLQFFKDGKFILELARAREGEKTSWISVPRKTFWPPTVSSTSANFHKHESSTSLSFSDDNSSIQSSPWQRDHGWKQTSPRSNVSREMCLYYHRPSCVRFKFSSEVLKRLRLKRRRPYEQAPPGVSLQYEIIRDRGEPRPGNADDDAMDLKVNGKSPEHTSDDDEAKGGARNAVTNGLAIENGTKDFTIRKRRGLLKRRKKLTVIVQQLTAQVATSTVNSIPRLPPTGIRAVFSSSHQQHVSPRKRILRELEKVSLEDSSTMKRSRPKTGSNSTVITATTATPLVSVTSNGTASSSSNNNSSSSSSVHSSSSNSNTSNGKLINGTASMPTIESRTAPVSTTPVSRPISSYSITSLLGHNSSNDSGNNNSSNSSTNRSKQETNSTTSHHPYQQHHQSSSLYSHLGKDVVTSPKSPSDTHLSQRYYGKKKSPSYGSQSAGASASPSSATEYGTSYGMIRSPDLSPSPEHQAHGFTRYRQHPYSMHPTVSSPSSYSTVSRCSPSPSTNDSAGSPYSGNSKYRAAYLVSSGSPPSSANPAPANSPQHYSRQSPLNFARSPPPPSLQQQNYSSSGSLRSAVKAETPLSPRASPSVEPLRVSATTPTSSTTTTQSIRTVPKKTAALRQQFGSPSSSPSATDTVKRERSNSNSSSSAPSTEINRLVHPKKELDYGERSLSMDVVDSPAAIASQASPVIRPSTVIASPTPHHPVPNPFYMYPPQIAASLIAAQQSTAVPFLQASPLSYYHMYNQAAAAAAAYRNPLWMHYQGLAPHAAAAAAAAAAVSPPSIAHAAAPPISGSASTGNSNSSSGTSMSSNRDAQRDSTRIHSSTNITSSGGSSNHSSNTNCSPSPATAALNYSAAALASSHHHVPQPPAHHSHHHHQQHHPHHTSGLSSPWSAPPHEPAMASSAASITGPATGKEEPCADVPLNLSKH